jgi:two-component system, NarL family, sensor histidine kinase DegS
MDTTLADLTARLEREQATLETELAEIEMLLRQATTEAERLEARRAQAEDRVATLERAADGTDELADARRQVIAETRRATLMAAQVDVLAGKQRALGRFRDHLAATLPVLRGATEAGAAAADSAPANGRAHGARDVLDAQEQLRKDITRRMHDGPAQSIANIALQAQVVQRLMERQPKQAQAELFGLVRMVESALEQTKAFIFEVRPMVLDDLGLVPTLRRATLERSRRSGVTVRFESAGADRRLPPERESAFFRIIDDALVGYLSGQPHDVSVRLDWTDGAVRGMVQARSGEADQSAGDKAKAVVAAARHEKTMPAALASMIREQEQETALRTFGLAPDVWQEVSERAAAAGLSVTLSEDRSAFEVVASTP